MKPVLFTLYLFSFTAVGACNTAPVVSPSSPDYQAPTVAPEIEEAIAVADTPQASQTKDSTIANVQIDSASKAIQKDTNAIKKPTLIDKAKDEATKAGTEIKKAANDATQTIKKESGKAAEALKKAGKELKQELKK